MLVFVIFVVIVVVFITLFCIWSGNFIRQANGAKWEAEENICYMIKVKAPP